MAEIIIPKHQMIVELNPLNPWHNLCLTEWSTQYKLIEGLNKKKNIGNYYVREKGHYTLRELINYADAAMVPIILNYFSLPKDTIQYLHFCYAKVGASEEWNIENNGSGKDQMNYFPHKDLYAIFQESLQHTKVTFDYIHTRVAYVAVTCACGCKIKVGGDNQTEEEQAEYGEADINGLCPDCNKNFSIKVDLECPDKINSKKIEVGSRMFDYNQKLPEVGRYITELGTWSLAHPSSYKFQYTTFQSDYLTLPGYEKDENGKFKYVALWCYADN